MTPLGMMPEDPAIEFVSSHPLAILGSKSQNGLRRISTDASGDALEELRTAFTAIETGSAAEDALASDLQRCTPCQERAIGDRLAEIIKGHRPNETPCQECLDEIERLNNMTPAQVMAEAKEIAMRIVQRVSQNAASPIDRLIATALPSIPAAVVSGWIMKQWKPQKRRLRP